MVQARRADYHPQQAHSAQSLTHPSPAAAPRRPPGSGAPRAPKSGYRGDVEGLRAVAILAVILYHAGIFGGGFVGVDVFFVISGYLITGLLWREVCAGGRVSFSSFYGRRARRLLPAAMLVLVATVVASAAILSPLAERDVAKDAAAAALYASNYRFAALSTNYLGARTTPSPLQHYWSLAVEEQFYLLWPIVVVGMALAWRGLRSRVGGRWGPGPTSAGPVALGLGAIGVASFGLSVHLTAVSQPWAFFSLPTRAWEFVAGGLIALGTPQLARLPRNVAGIAGWIGAALILWSVLTFSGSTPFPGTAALFPVGGTALLIAVGCAAPKRGTSLALSHRPLPAIGRISYAWYLWHWPALTLGEAAAGHPLSMVQKLALVAVTGWLAFLTVELLENPIRFSPRLMARPTRSLALGAFLTVTATCVALITAETLPVLRGGSPAAAVALPVAPAARTSAPASPTKPRYDPAMAAVSAAVDRAVETMDVPSNLSPSLEQASNSLAPPFREGCDNSYTDASLHPCTFGDRQSATTVMLLGDSHAAQWFPAVDQLAVTHDWRVVSLTKAICPPVLIPIWNPVFNRPFTECEQWRTSALAWIAREKPTVVVLGAARHYGPEYRFHVYGPDWLGGLAAMVKEIRAIGPQVVVMGPVPHPSGNVPDCLSGHLSDAVACTRPLTAAVNPAGIAAEQAAVLAAGGSYINVIPWVCSPAACAVIVGNILVFRDDNHITTTFATWLSPVLDGTITPLTSMGGSTRATGPAQSPAASSVAARS
jgi:peptidoglycan/LPS O-acetylase OafA/YrhL